MTHRPPAASAVVPFSVLLASAAAVRRRSVRGGRRMGDPLPTGVVLWTRIAPDPVAADGRGGVPEPNRSLAVAWEVSEREPMTSTSPSTSATTSTKAPGKAT